VPLGGSKYVIPNTLLVFSFVALWHDLSFRLLAWGWLISLFVVPELLASYLLPYRTYGKLPWYRHACAVGGMFNAWMMATANLIGFVVGLDGVGFLMEQLFGTKDGWVFFVVGSLCLFSAVQLMFEYRYAFFSRGICGVADFSPERKRRDKVFIDDVNRGVKIKDIEVL